MKPIQMKLTIGKAAVGATKLYGNPDVPGTFEWPAIVDEDDIYDLTFMGQVNLWELAAASPDAPLPKQGMLYVFYDLDAMAFSPFDETAARVILWNGEAPLEELCLEDEGGNSLCYPIRAVAFEEAEKGDGHQLFGLPRGYDTACYPRPIEGWVMLLQIPSTDTVAFEGGGSLCFFIAPDRLEQGDFSDVRVMIVPRK